ncbi:multiple C2 and transmembrane domain-containing protein 2 isoform X2 [Mugil cephalus]|uniref:multiple C2 and transmembrane domain-containing protein 2 isoform X2 n=1 Tax=Mugil cephalus TaxID=48193 RepID=UPI001FB5FB58|nr:multiple C2 and transmembrane domain-containing protein 2 isoform X2 [Mugil cephalus]
MDVKKKNFFDNFKNKFPKKKPQKKLLAKQGRNLAHRRSLSVPDLSCIPSEACSADSTDGNYFGISPGLSDSDSVASSSLGEGPLVADKLSDSFPETTFRAPHVSNPAAASHRMSAPVEVLYEEVKDTTNLSREKKVNFVHEGLYAQVDKRARRNAQQFIFEPTPAPRHVFNSAQAPSSRTDLVDRASLSGERASLSGEDPPTDRVISESVAAALARANSMGEQTNPYEEKKTTSFEQKRPSAEKGSLAAIREYTSVDRMSLSLDTQGPLENADGTSLASTCDSPSDEQVNVFWTTDSEEVEREPFTPLIMRELSVDEEHLDESAEMSCDLFGPLEENSQDAFESPELLAGGEIHGPAPFQRYLLNINLKQGRNLVIRDKRSGSSDPYVKFKLEGKQFYKSKVVYKNLNPHWNESFSYPLRDKDHVVEVRVYDKNRTSDDFMGSSAISVKHLDLYKTYEMELRLDDPKSKEDDMGVILVDVCLMFRDATIKKGPRWPQKKNKNQATPSPRHDQPKNQLKNQMWSGVLRVTLVEGQNMPQYGQGDVYVRFRLGDQKYKSKNLCIQANPQWREQFDFNHFEDNQEPLQVEVCSKRGRKCEESWGMFDVDVSRLPLNEKQYYTNVLNPGKGNLMFLATLRPSWGISVSDIESATLSKPDERDTVVERFNLKNSHKCVEEVGFLQVNVIRANDLSSTDLNGKSNPFCVVELGNCKLHTHTICKTLNPEWNKAVTFPIKDIHDVIELTVLDENGDKTNFLGKVAIPLLTVQNGQQVCLHLKKEDLGNTSKGTITLVMEVIYNKIRAGIKTFQPKEAKLSEESVKFSKKVLAENIYRVRKISTAVLYTLQYIKSCVQWESTQRSLIAFLIFLVTVWNWELFMLPLFLLLLIGWNYFQLTKGKASSNQDLVNMTMGDDEEEDEKEAAKKGLMDKIHMVQEVVLVVQTALEELANIGERVKNIFNWSVPFLSCLAGLVLFVAATLLYFIPLRYIVLIWGVNVFTKKLRNPYAIDNNEILDFLKRVPSDVQKVQYSVRRAPTSQNQPRKKK